MLTEQFNPTDEITIDALRNLHIREVTVLVRDGVPDPKSREYHRYVLQPGDDVGGRHPLVQQLAALLWTPEAVDAFKAAREWAATQAGI